MVIYKRMLVPLDGSGFGECALEHMKAIATGCNVPEVDLLFVVEPIPATATTTYARSVEGQEKLMALGDNLLKVVRALIAHTEREKTDSFTKLRMDLYATGVMPNLFPPKKK